jgi:hypothetical protein
MLAADGEEQPALRDLADYLREEESKVKKETRPLPYGAPAYARILAEAFDSALDMTGRMGKEALYALLEKQHNIVPIDISSKPGEFMSVLRSLLESSALVIETYMLAHIKEMTGVAGWTLEDAVDKLKSANFASSD